MTNLLHVSRFGQKRLLNALNVTVNVVKNDPDDVDGQ